MLFVAWVSSGESNGPAVVNTNTPTDGSPRGSAKVNGWVALAAGYGAESPSADTDIYLVREGSPAHRIAGSEDDVINQVCPAFSPDTARVAYGQAEGTAEPLSAPESGPHHRRVDRRWHPGGVDHYRCRWHVSPAMRDLVGGRTLACVRCRNVESTCSSRLGQRGVGGRHGDRQHPADSGGRGDRHRVGA